MANLITLTIVRETCDISPLVEDARMQTWLNLAEVRLEKILGRTGYALLVAAKLADPTFALTANADFLLLQPHYEPMLAWLTYLLAMNGMRSRPDRAGWFTKEGVDYKTIDKDTLAMNEATIRSAYESYLDRLMNELQFGSAGGQHYTWWYAYVPGEERISAPDTAGISFRRSRRQNAYGVNSGADGSNHERYLKG